MDSHGLGLKQMDNFDSWVFLQPLIELQFSRRIDVGCTIAEYLGFQWFHDNLLENFWIIQQCAAIIATFVTFQPDVNRGRDLPFEPIDSTEAAVGNRGCCRVDQIIMINIKGLKFAVKILSNQKIWLDYLFEKSDSVFKASPGGTYQNSIFVVIFLYNPAHTPFSELFQLLAI